MSILVIISVLVIIFIAILIFYHLKNFNRINQNIEILQVADTSKDNLENLCRNNQPIIIYKLSQTPTLKFSNQVVVLQKSYSNLKDIKNIDISDYLSKYQKSDYFLIEKMDNNNINNEFVKLLKLYHSPLCYNIENSITIFNSKFTRNLTYTNISRNIYICIEGECIFHLYHPKNKNNIEFLSGNHSYYEVSKFEEKHKSLNKCSFTEIILRQYQSIIIPRYWIFTYYTPSKCKLINSKSKELIEFINFF